MSSKANPTLIGAFVVGAAGLIVAGILVFGGGRFWTEKLTYVMYFEGSLAGLNVGAPVNFRGVKLGSVSRIVVRHDSKTTNIRIPVYVEIEPGRVESERAGTDPAAVIQTMVDRGLRAQLQMQSYLTGLLAVELDFHPDRPARLVGADEDVPELPTIPSTMDELTKTFKDLPIEEIAKELHQTLQGINQLVRSPDLAEAIRSATRTLNEIQQLARKINGHVDPLAQEMKDTLASARGAIGQAKTSIASVETALTGTLEQVKGSVTSVEGALSATLGDVRKLAKNVDDRIDPIATSLRDALAAARSALGRAETMLAAAEKLVAEDSTTVRLINDSLQQLSAALRNIRDLAEYFEQHPDALFRGKGVPGGQ